MIVMGQSRKHSKDSTTQRRQIVPTRGRERFCSFSVHLAPESYSSNSQGIGKI